VFQTIIANAFMATITIIGAAWRDASIVRQTVPFQKTIEEIIRIIPPMQPFP
jgi:hypothetical protein